MTPWDDVEVDSDGDEMLDWLWDLPDRYDVGIDDDPTAPGAVLDGAGRPGVRKRVRRPDEATAAAAAPAAAAGLADDRPTLAVDLAEPFDDVDYGGDTMFAPGSRRESWLSRYTTRELATAAAVFVGVIALAGIGYAVTSNKGAPKPSNLAIGSAPTTATTVAGVVATPGAATTSSTDTTVPPDTTSTAPPPTDTSEPSAFGGFTSTTVHRCVYTVAFRVPADTSTVPPSTSPPTTSPPTTTPPTTTPPTTTPPTTVPPTTVPPTTLPPTTVTTVPPTTVPPTTVTTKPPPTTAPPPATTAPPPATTIPKLVCR